MIFLVFFILFIKTNKWRGKRRERTNDEMKLKAEESKNQKSILTSDDNQALNCSFMSVS